MPHKSPNVSLVVCVFNKEMELRHLLDSLLLLEYTGHLEVVVVDDCSSTNILEVVESFKRRQNRISVIYHRMALNSGPAAARNAGASLSSDEYIWFLDSDTEIVHSAMIDDVLAYFEQFPYVGVIGGEMQPIGDDLYYLSYGHYPNLTHWTELSLVSGKENIPPVIKKDILATSNVFLRRELFDRVGGFRTDCVCLEDLDFGLRIMKLGYYRLISSRTAVVHHHSRTGRTGGKFAFYDDPYELALVYHENRFRILCEHYSMRARFLPLLDAVFLPLTTLRSSRSKNAMLHVSGKVGRQLKLLSFIRIQLFGLLRNYFRHYIAILFRGKIRTYTLRRSL